MNAAASATCTWPPGGRREPARWYPGRAAGTTREYLRGLDRRLEARFPRVRWAGGPAPAGRGGPERGGGAPGSGGD